MVPVGERGIGQERVGCSVVEIGELEPATGPTGNGPATYYRFPGAPGTVGVITPMSHNFCESCNRVRLTATGQLYMCLGQGDMVDLRAVLREAGPDVLDAALDRAMLLKPKGHDFVLDRDHTGPALARHMSVTGG